jgi:hypothetical protein
MLTNNQNNKKNPPQKKSTVKNGKTPSRHVSSKNKPIRVASSKKSESAKNAGAIARTGRNNKAKSARSKKEETRTVAKKKNVKGTPHANALKKRAKG